MLDQLKLKLPLLFGLVHTGQFKKSLANAIAIFEKDQPNAWDRFHDAADAPGFRSRSLLYHLFMSLRIEGGYDPTAELIEGDLERIKRAGVSEDQMRAAFLSKLVNDTQFDDVMYEIASAAIFSQILDSGTCSLEEPLAGSAVNPDLTGEWQGKRTRVEVKRVDDMPPRYEPEALTIIESAEIPGGFDVHLSIPLTKTSEAQFIKRMIEQLHEHRTLKPGETVKVGSSVFTMGRPYLSTLDHLSPIRSVLFNENLDLRTVQPGVFTGPSISSTEQTILDEAFPTPKGVQVFGNKSVNPSARLKSTKGERVYGDVQGKIRQCEVGAINIVVLGLSAPHYQEHDLTEGLLGSTFVLARFGSEEAGPELTQSRTGLGPFTDAAHVDALPTETEKQFPGLIEMIRAEIDGFAKVSGVLGIRLSSGYPLAVFRANQNAASPLPADAGEIILQRATARASCLIF